MLVHTERYIDAVRAAGHFERGDWSRFGFGPGDNPIFADMHEASARVVGSTLAAAEAVWSGRAQHAFNPAGGLHHAMPERASGFCVYDDPAVAIRWLLEQGAERDRVRGRRRPPRRRAAGDLLRRTPRADDLDARGRAVPVPGHRVRRRDGTRRRGRDEGERPADAVHGRRLVAVGVQGGRGAAGDAVAAGRAGDAAGVRHASRRIRWRA